MAAANLEAAYLEMALDEAGEAEALEWAEATIGDVADEPREVDGQVQLALS
jgi:hypothetical protein